VQAHNAVIHSPPVLPYPSATTEPATAFVDLDVFEDVDADGVHDNSAGAEQLEGNQPTELPYLEEDGDFEELALIVNNAVPGATILFDYSTNELQLYRDIMGLYPLGPGQISLSDLGISGSGSMALFAKGTVGGEQSSGVRAQLSGGSTGSTRALGGGLTRRLGNDPRRPDDPAWHNNADDWEGGLDDGDGPGGPIGQPDTDPLTNRDDFWIRNAGRRTLMIGFSGHTQSRGTHGVGGRIWSIFDVGARQIGQTIYDTFGPGAGGQWAVTMFPEDPGNDNFAVLARCGDGVIGRGNPWHGDQRVDALGRPTGALAFLVDAILNHNVNRVGLFGYSHGAGSVQILMKALAQEAYRMPALRDALLTVLLDDVHRCNSHQLPSGQSGCF
jgi:hypothetical protein